MRDDIEEGYDLLDESVCRKKRVEFEFTPKMFWVLIPTIALNYYTGEIECCWLCFGMYIKGFLKPKTNS